MLPFAHLAKYTDRIAALGIDAEKYAATYSQVIRIVPDGFLGWHGRTFPRASAWPEPRPASLDEPRREGDVDKAGEPVSRHRAPVIPASSTQRRLRSWSPSPRRDFGCSLAAWAAELPAA